MEVKHHFSEHGIMKASGVSLSGFFRVVDSNPDLRIMYTILEVTLVGKVEVKVTSILTIWMSGTS